jgi:hypothetical protein
MHHVLWLSPTVKPLQEHSRSSRASGARLAGPLTRPYRKCSQTRGEGRAISRLQHLREPGRRTRRCSGATIGDSPKSPLKQLGESRLKPAKKPKLNASCLSAHTGHGPHRGGPRGPPRRPTQRSPRAGSASLEGTHLPRAGSAPLEGTRLPRAGSALLEDALHAHARSRARVRAFNALTTAGRHHHAPGTHAPVLLHQLPRGTHPHRCGGLCNVAGVSPVTSRRLLPYG